MTGHDHERRDGRPVTDPDLCHWCNRAELARHPLAGNTLTPGGPTRPLTRARTTSAPTRQRQPTHCGPMVDRSTTR